MRDENDLLIKLLKFLGNANELNLKEKMMAQSIVQKKFGRQEENNNQEG